MGFWKWLVTLILCGQTVTERSSWISFICADLDECHIGSFTCHARADCVNVPGSYSCRCRPGYVGNGRTVCAGKVFSEFSCWTVIERSRTVTERSSWISFFCADLDECHIGSFTCHAHADCVNVPGSYSCRCRSGYVGNGRTVCTGKVCSEFSCWNPVFAVNKTLKHREQNTRQ